MNLPASSSEMEASTGRIPAEGEREVQSARPANRTPSLENVQDEGINERPSEASPFEQGMTMDGTNKVEVSSNPSYDSRSRPLDLPKLDAA